MKYAYQYRDFMFHPLLIDFVIQRLIAPLNISPKVLYLSPPAGDRGLRFMIMEKGGPSLSDYYLIKKDTIPTANPIEAIHALMQIIGMLEKMHAMGFVHRDVKPINILFSDPRVEKPNPSTDRLMLIDFEYARPIGPEFTRAEDIHEAVHCAVKMNGIFMKLFPNFYPFPGGDPFRKSPATLQRVEEDLDAMRARLGTERMDPLVGILAEFYALLPPKEGEGIEDEPKYQELIGKLEEALMFL